VRRRRWSHDGSGETRSGGRGAAALSAVVALVVGLLALGGGSALAEAPTQVTDQITDDVGAIGTAAATAAAATRIGTTTVQPTTANGTVPTTRAAVIRAAGRHTVLMRSGP
jgi:hypothetical protein